MTIRPTIKIISREKIVILARLALLVFFRGNWVRKSRSDIRPLKLESENNNNVNRSHNLKALASGP